MYKQNIGLTIIFIIMLFSIGNKSSGQQKKILSDQKPFVAGRFYPSEPAELQGMLRDFYAKAKPDQHKGEVIAIISPHAGYIFSGQVAASAFNQVDPDKEYKTVFVIGTSHQALFKGASIYSKGNFITPLGTVMVDIDLADKILLDNPVFTSETSAFAMEHSIEVQLPFLQTHLKKPFKIIPILLGTQDPKECREIAEALLPWFNAHNLFVFSSDFSHYPGYQDAVTTDKITADAIMSGSSIDFLKTIGANEEKNIPGLATSACGWTNLLTLLYMVEKTPGIKINLVDYMNSGDTQYGDKQKVVGYNALSVSLEKGSSQGTKDFSLSESEQKILLEIARNSIDNFISKNEYLEINTENLPESLKSNVGVFVTLTKKGNLRGCIGRMTGGLQLYKGVQEMAVSAALKDHRFEKVSPGEMKDIEIEISVLSPMKKIQSIEEIEMGKHGIYIKKGGQSGTFLPQVGKETGWSREDFLGHCARDKAGIGWEGWKEANIYIYEAFIFHEKGVEK
jgi:AmmeMemoRadiSam system protein B/AmmeMemoRadiSam system protein A